MNACHRVIRFQAVVSLPGPLVVSVIGMQTLKISVDARHFICNSVDSKCVQRRQSRFDGHTRFFRSTLMIGVLQTLTEESKVLRDRLKTAHSKLKDLQTLRARLRRLGRASRYQALSPADIRLAGPATPDGRCEYAKRSVKE